MKNLIYCIAIMPLIFVGCENKDTRQETNNQKDTNVNQVKHQKHQSFLVVKKMLSEVLEIDPSGIEPETKLSDLGLKIQTDDIDYMELVMHIEAEFEIEISDQDAKKFTTVGEICDYIDKK